MLIIPEKGKIYKVYNRFPGKGGYVGEITL